MNFVDILQAITLGIVQGVTEFLPVSSSGHLVLAPWIFGWEYQGVSFDAAVHMGTLLGVVSYFWREWKGMLLAFKSRLNALSGQSPGADGTERAKLSTSQQRLLFFIIIATIPGAVAGYLFKDDIEGVFRSPEVVAASLILFSFVMLAGEKLGSKLKDLSYLSWQKALLVGAFQALAVIPGVSRSGATISAGLLLGFSRAEAAKFSFLLSAPIIFGAGLFKFPDMLREGIDLAFAMGVVTSAIAGYFAIKFLFKFVEKGSYMAFVWYRIVLGLIIFALIWVN